MPRSTDGFTRKSPTNARFVLAKTDSKFESIKPDNLYIVGEGGASIPSAIAVGSFTTTVTDQHEKEGAQQHILFPIRFLGSIQTTLSLPCWHRVQAS